jgi:hypothetical protein
MGLTNRGDKEYKERLAQVERERQLEKATQNAVAFRDRTYGAYIGEIQNYIGINAYESNVEIDIVEWTTIIGSVTLTHEGALALIAGLEELMGAERETISEGEG